MRGERQLTRLGAPFHRPVGLIRHLPDGTLFGTRIAANIAKLPELLRRSPPARRLLQELAEEGKA